MRTLQRTLRKKNPVVCNDPYVLSHDLAKTGHQGLPVIGLEFVEAATVQDAGKDQPDIEGFCRRRRHNATQFLRIVQRLVPRCRCCFTGAASFLFPFSPYVCHNVPRHVECLLFGRCRVIHNARNLGMNPGTAQGLRRDLFPRGRLDQGWPAQKNRSVSLDDYRFVGHAGNVGATGRARATNDCNLRDCPGRHVGLVEKNPPEVVPIGKDPRLFRQKGPPAVDQIDAGQIILESDFLGPQVFLDGDGEIGPPLDGRVVGHDRAQPARDHPDPGDDPAAGNALLVSGQGGELQEGSPRIAQRVDPVPGQELVPLEVAFDGPGSSSLRDLFEEIVEFFHLLPGSFHGTTVGLGSRVEITVGECGRGRVAVARRRRCRRCCLRGEPWGIERGIVAAAAAACGRSGVHYSVVWENGLLESTGSGTGTS
mmetsp:Transcript_17232/g.35400  ORF Transcript_17232/g.35400 Transcript_17232/m.35400 type:complete len:424 (-) Transcript_17232:171-1442(-)